MRDREYTYRNFLQVKLGDLDNAILFFENAIYSMEEMNEGDRFDLELPDGNVGEIKRIAGVKVLCIEVGDIGEFGILRKKVASNILKKLLNE